MKYILSAIGIILLISSIIFGLLFFRERAIFDRYKIVSSNETNQLKTVNEYLKGSFMESQFYNNNKISFSGSKNLSDFTFCLFISENHCSACVNAILKYYTSYLNIVPDSNFSILANFNHNSIIHLKALHQLKCKIISTIGTNVNIAENKYPCFFIYNKKRSETEMFFFPLRNEPEMGRSILKLLIRNISIGTSNSVYFFAYGFQF